MMKPFFCVMLSGYLFLTACATRVETPVLPENPSSTVSKQEASPIIIEKKVIVQPKTHTLGIIGEVEPVYFLPMKSAFLARIDTGAKNSSIGVDNLQEFEREGRKWVSFDLINRQTKEQHHFEKRLNKQTRIKRFGESEERFVVPMTVRIGKEKLTTAFSLTDRSKFDYQALVGRNILKGRAIVDTALSKTLY